jgi:small-conductance mechanosensitive channel
MISVVVRFSLISVGIFLAVSAIGMPLNQLTIIISAFSVGIGFGLQNIVNNFVSGIVLLFERPVQIGDTVEVNNLIGTVKSMGIRSSNIRTFDGAEVIVPNANLISSEVINWTLSDKKRRIEIISGVAYGSDVYHVKEILLGILNHHPDILKEPEPLVLFNDLGESSLDFRLLFWTDNYDKWIIIKSEVIFKIHDALKEAKITIPFPQRDLHIKTQNTD